MIEVRLFATLRMGRQKIINFEPGTVSNVNDILSHLSIQPDEMAICLINGRHSDLSSPVKDGDVIAVFPPSGGG